MNEKRPVPPETRIPEPPHPVRRRQPLPGHHPKSPTEDPGAPGRIRGILESPGYRLAEKDPDFFARDDTRGLRLQTEYLKAELLLQEHGVRNTVVVFGSTRIPEAAVARSNVETLRAALESNRGDAAAAHQLAVAERILAKCRYYDEARAFGRLVGENSGQDGVPWKLVVMTAAAPPFRINTPILHEKTPACDRGLLTFGRFRTLEANGTPSSVLRASNRVLHAHATGTSRVRALPTSNYRDG
jgi:hypothetical protein